MDNPSVMAAMDIRR